MRSLASTSVPNAYFSFNKCPIQTHDGANSKFSTNRDETDYSVCFATDSLASKFFLKFHILDTKSRYLAEAYTFCTSPAPPPTPIFWEEGNPQGHTQNLEALTGPTTVPIAVCWPLTPSSSPQVRGVLGNTCTGQHNLNQFTLKSHLLQVIFWHW